MKKKVFSQRFNRELTALDFPDELSEKIKAISKVFGVNLHESSSFIFGHLLPNNTQMNKIAEILDVCPQWLGGEVVRKKAYPGREVAESV